MSDIVFWILSIVTVGAALAVVILKDVFRAALSLVLLFCAIAAIYVTLYADFLAIVQVLIYVGAISILIIVAIMLTQNIRRGNPFGRLHLPALIVSLLVFGTLVFTIVSAKWATSSELPLHPTTGVIGSSLFGVGGFILQVEMAAVLLLAAVLGAIVIMKEK